MHLNFNTSSIVSLDYKEIGLNREEQFNRIEGLITWYDEIMNHYEAAFWVHYRMLCNAIDTWIQEVEANGFAARVAYFIHTEYMSMVLCELLLTCETLFKAELAKAGYTGNLKKHKLIDLLGQMSMSNDIRCMSVADRFDSCKAFFTSTDNDNSFVNARYLDYDKPLLDENTASSIKGVVLVLDDVYEEFYLDINLEHLLYLSMSYDDENLSDDDKRRLSNLGLI